MKNSKKNSLRDILRIGGFYRISDYFQNKTKVLSFPKVKTKEKVPESWIKVNYKSYPRFSRLILPEPEKLEMCLGKSIKSRRSRRKFSNGSIDLRKLSSLILYSSGIIFISKKDKNNKLRAYPSAGGRYPIELYLIVNNIESLDKGLYHFNVKENSLEPLLNADLSKKIAKLTGQDFVKKASVVFLLTGILDRTRIKYGDRGLRYIYMECGHITQNLYLISEALNLSCCSIGGFVDNEINKLLDIQFSSEKTLYLVAIGNKKNEHT